MWCFPMLNGLTCMVWHSQQKSKCIFPITCSVWLFFQHFEVWRTMLFPICAAQLRRLSNLFLHGTSLQEVCHCCYFRKTHGLWWGRWYLHAQWRLFQNCSESWSEHFQWSPPFKWKLSTIVPWRCMRFEGSKCELRQTLETNMITNLIYFF